MEKGLVLCLAFILLVCSSAFAVTVSDLKPDDRVKDLHILVPSDVYKKEVSSVLLEQPFFSYKDVDVNIFIYNSSIVEALRGYDLMVIFEDWGNETTAKLRFERDFKFESGFLEECDVMFNRMVKKCEKAKYPQWVYVLYYHNFLIRVQPHSDYPFTVQELFYLSFDALKIVENILSKISRFENPVEGKPAIPGRKIIVIEEGLPAEEQALEGPKQGFFSRNKYYIFWCVGLILIFIWMFRSRNFSWGVFIIILGLIIFNRFTGFTRNEVITWALLWTLTYFFFEWFYMHNIKKHKGVRKKSQMPPEKYH